MRDCHAGAVQAIIVTKWDRVSRTALVGLQMAAQLEELNVPWS
jgi:hypothetical protein